MEINNRVRQCITELDIFGASDMWQRQYRRIALGLLTLGLSRGVSASNVGSVTITGVEQSSGSTFDIGSVTVTLNGHIETVTYGPFSTASSIASAMAAKLSMDCGGVVNAKANGATVSLKMRGTGNNITSLALSTSYDSGHFAQASFTGTGSTPITITPNPNVVTYAYHDVNYDAAGNVSSYSDTVNGSWSFAAGYDALNRLVGAIYAPVGGSSSLSYCWSYDDFGNRLTQATGSGFSGTPGGECSSRVTGSLYTNAWATYNQNNRTTANSLSVAPNSLLPDAAGNMTTDGTRDFLYDGDGRICAVNNGTLIGYTYDAEGQRVAKGRISQWSCNPATNGFTMTNEYFLGPNGEPMTEFDGSGGWVNTSVKAEGELVATYNNDGQGVHFHLNDWLGTRRMTTNYAGVPELTCSNGAFGDNLNCVGASQGVADVTQQHFTGKERDAESGLDNFGARYMNSSMGRFMSPDPLGIAAGNLGSPQSLNLYSYVLNNPLIFTDPDGRECVWDDGSYDSNDDKDTGSPDKCSGQGGTWIGHDVFSNSQYYRGDWSGKANGDLSGLVSNIQSCSAAVGGGQAQSLLIADAFTLGYSNDEASYLLASARWESNMGSSMTESGGAAYWSQYDGNAALGNTQKGDGTLFRGRGYIQITGRRAYEGWSKVLGVNLVSNPGLTTDPDIAAQIAAEGSFRGTFTGKSLYDYINGGGSNFVNARRVINGDVAKNGSAIAGIANGFASSMSGCR